MGGILESGRNVGGWEVAGKASIPLYSKNNRKTLYVAPKTPIKPITGGIWVRPVAARRSANNCDRRTDDTTMEP